MIEGVVLGIITPKVGDIFSKEVPSTGRKFPSEIPTGELELRMQQSFLTRNKWVKRGYFAEGDKNYPDNLAFFVYGRDKSKSNQLVSGLVATQEETEGFNFIYYDKIFVIPNYRQNGLTPSMINLAREVRADNKDGGSEALLSVLRTSDPDLHHAYSKISDTWTQIDGYFVHGFGFVSKKTKAEMFEGAKEKFDIVAQYVASKPATLNDAPLTYKMLPKLGIKIDHSLIEIEKKLPWLFYKLF